MIVSVASGKGGTGKTTVSASLAHIWDGQVLAVDLDVEEPDLHLFLHPVILGRETGYMEIPSVDEALCTYCAACSDLCQFKAISVMNNLILTFPEMCHGCGGCIAICPAKALSAGKRELGEICWGEAPRSGFLAGILRVGEAMSPPLMRLVKKRLTHMIATKGGDAIIDAPPGVSCPAVNAVMDSDVIVLVVEPTPFGCYDFKLALDAFSPFGKPMGVVVNRAGLGDDAIYRLCRDSQVPVLAEIPYQRAIAEAYARGGIIAGESWELSQIFISLQRKICSLAKRSGALEAGRT